MNIAEIKERVGLRSYMKTLCNAPKFEGTMNYNGAEEDVEYLLSIIEQAEKKIKRLQWAASNTFDNLNQLKSTDVEDAKQFLYNALTESNLQWDE